MSVRATFLSPSETSMAHKFALLGLVVSLGFAAFGCNPVDSEDVDSDELEINAGTTGVDFAKGADKKVTVCHVPPGNHAKAHSIEVGASALAAHLKHGDFPGECDGDGDGGEGGEGGGGPVCSENGVTCSDDANCCSGICGGSGMCAAQCTVGPELGGASCSSDLDCCDGACVGGACFVGLTCKTAGAACDPNAEACCFDLQSVDGICQ